jgi:hypothetical protein
MSGLCVQGRDGKIVLSRSKFAEVETGLHERAERDAKHLRLPAGHVDDEMYSTFVLFRERAWSAVDDQVKSDIGIDADQLDSTQRRRLLWSYAIAFCKAQREAL